MGLPGGWEWVIIILFALIFFGAKRLPEMARGLGKGIREFKNAVAGIQDEVERAGELKSSTTSDKSKEQSQSEQAEKEA